MKPTTSQIGAAHRWVFQLVAAAVALAPVAVGWADDARKLPTVAVKPPTDDNPAPPPRGVAPERSPGVAPKGAPIQSTAAGTAPAADDPAAKPELSAEERAMAEYAERKRLENDPKARAAAAKAAAAAKKAEAARVAAEKKAEAARIAAEKKAEAAAQKAEAAWIAAEAKAAAAAEKAEKAKAAAEAKAAAAAERKLQEQAKIQAAAEAKAQAAQAAAEAKAQAERAAADAAEKAAADKAAAAAVAEKVAADKAAAEAKAAEATIAADFASAKAANTSGSWVGFLLRYPRMPQAATAHAELQRAVVREQATWLTASEPTQGGDWVEVALAKAPESLRDDLSRLRARSWRVLAPRDVSATWTLRNPVGRPMLVAMALAGQRFHVLVPAGDPVTGKAVAACLPDGAPSMEVRDGVLDYKLSCKVAGPLILVGAQLVEADLAADKRACDAALSLEVLAQLLATQPGSWLGPVWADRVDDAMAEFASNVKAIKASAKSSGKPSATAGVAVDVNFRSAARFDATVFYTVGTGRVERLLVERGKSAGIKLVTRPGLPADLQVLRLMPRLRAADWLYGAWRTARATIVIAPGRDGAPVAAFLGTDDAGRPKTVVAPVTIDGDTFRFAGPAGVAFVRSLLGDTDTVPLRCDAGCELRVRGSLAKQEGFEADGQRQLLVDIEAGDRSKPLRLLAGH